MLGSRRHNRRELLVVPHMFNNTRTVLREVWAVASSLVALVHVSLCHEACKRSLILKFWAWRSPRKFMEKLLKFSGYTLKLSHCHHIINKIHVCLNFKMEDIVPSSLATASFFLLVDHSKYINHMFYCSVYIEISCALKIF